MVVVNENVFGISQEMEFNGFPGTNRIEAVGRHIITIWNFNSQKHYTVSKSWASENVTKVVHIEKPNPDEG